MVSPVRLLRLVLFLVLLALSLAALLFLLPWLKEGYDIAELPLFAGVAAGLSAAAALWWALNRRSPGGALAIGLGVLAVPLAAYLLLSARVVFNEWRGRRLAGSVRVVALRETPLSWPGLDGPVGIRLEIEVEHAAFHEGNLFAPKIVMAADPRPNHRDYFFGALDHGVDAYLGPPMFESTGPPRDVLGRPGRTRLVYELFPSTLSRREGAAVCLTDRVGGGRELLAQGGSNLGAAWFFAAPGGLYVDMSTPLTEALRQSSALQGRHGAWQEMMARVRREPLLAAGWRECLPSRHVAENCYCAPSAAAPPDSGLATRESPTVP